MTDTTLLRRAARVVGVLGFATLSLCVAQAAAQPPELGSAESFAVLAGSTVTNSGATAIVGDVGAAPGQAITGFPPGTTADGGTLHEGDAVAAQARIDALAAYDDAAGRECPNTLVGDLGAQSPLSPGVYCVDGPAQLTGTLTLTGAGPWIFQIAGTLTTASGASVVVAGSTQTCNGSEVFWQVGGNAATLGAGTTFVGNLVGRTDVTLESGVTLDGRALALDGSVTMDIATVSACSFGSPFSPHAPVKMTGGGQIAVPTDASSTDPAEDGDGRASYGFNAHPPASPGAPATGHLNYMNTAAKLHGNGTVTDLDVLTVDSEGLPKLVRFSGTCAGAPECTFSVTAEDNGEPGTADRFGITIVIDGMVVEARSLRVISRGNIQMHESLTTALPTSSFDAGDVLQLSASLTPGTAPTPVDAYLVLRLPNGQFLSWTGNGFAPGLVPMRRNLMPVRYSGVVLQTLIPPGTPAGTYAWLSALASPGTLNLLTPITETTFTIK